MSPTNYIALLLRVAMFLRQIRQKVIADSFSQYYRQGLQSGASKLSTLLVDGGRSPR